MEVKGTAVAILPEYVRRKHGEAAFLKWLGSLPEGSRRLFQSPVRLSDWFPGDMAYLEPTAAVCRMFFPDETTKAPSISWLIRMTCRTIWSSSVIP